MVEKRALLLEVEFKSNLWIKTMKKFARKLIKCFLTDEGTPVKRALVWRLYENLGKLKVKEIIIVLDSCFARGGEQERAGVNGTLTGGRGK